MKNETFMGPDSSCHCHSCLTKVIPGVCQDYCIFGFPASVAEGQAAESNIKTRTVRWRVADFSNVL